MTLLALTASLASAPPPANLARDLGGKSSSGSKFADIVDALTGEIRSRMPAPRRLQRPRARKIKLRRARRRRKRANRLRSTRGSPGSSMARWFRRSPAAPASRASGARGAVTTSEQANGDSAAAKRRRPPATLRRALTGRGADASSRSLGRRFDRRGHDVGCAEWDRRELRARGARLRRARFARGCDPRCIRRHERQRGERGGARRFRVERGPPRTMARRPPRAR